MTSRNFDAEGWAQEMAQAYASALALGDPNKVDLGTEAARVVQRKTIALLREFVSAIGGFDESNAVFQILQGYFPNLMLAVFPDDAMAFNLAQARRQYESASEMARFLEGLDEYETVDQYVASERLSTLASIERVKGQFADMEEPGS